MLFSPVHSMLYVLIYHYASQYKDLKSYEKGKKVKNKLVLEATAVSCFYLF